MKEVTLLDGDCSITTTCIKNHAKSKWGASNSLCAEASGVSTSTKQKCHICDVGEHWFSAKFMENMLPLSSAVD